MEPRVIGTWDSSVELCCLTGREDDDDGSVVNHAVDRELVLSRVAVGERRLELGEPAAQCDAASVPVMVWVMAFGRLERVVRDVGDSADEREAVRDVRACRMRCL